MKRNTLNTQAVNDNEFITKAYVDQFHQENERSRRDTGLSFYDEEVDLLKNIQENDLNDNKLTNLHSITVNKNPSSDNELSNEKHVDDSIGEGTIHRFNQTLQIYLKVSVGGEIYNLTKNGRVQFTDTTEIKIPKTGSDLLQKCNIKCNNMNNDSKVGNFEKSTIPSSPTGQSGAESKPLISTNFMYYETSSDNIGSDNVFVSFERTDIIQISNFTFYFNRYLILFKDSKKSLGRFKIVLLLDNITRSNQNTIPKNSQYSNSSTEWKLLNLDFYYSKLWHKINLRSNRYCSCRYVL